jgi:putative ABC transport system permease protein
MVPIARRNLLSDKVKLLVAVGGVTLAIVLMIVINSLYQGVRRDTVTFIHSMPGDFWVMQEGTTDLVFSDSHLPLSEVDQIRRIEGVERVTALNGRLMAFEVDGKQVRTYVMALDYLGEGKTGRGSEFVPGPGRIILDKTFARQAGVGVGDVLRWGPAIFQVARVETVGNVLVTQFSFVSAEDFSEQFGTPETVNFLLVTLERDANAPAVQRALERDVEDADVWLTDEWADKASERGTGDFLPIIRVIMTISFIVGLAVLSLVIYTATIERAREYAIMKVIGASPLALYRIVLSQSTFIAIVGFGLGVALAFAFNYIAGDAVPQFVTYIRPVDIGFVLLATAVMTLVASVLPLQRIARVEPASVFRA